MISGTYSRDESHDPSLSLASAAPFISAAQAQRLLQRLDTWAALAVVVLASSTTLCAAVYLIERWQLR
jgi:hypothetical protein